MSNAASNPDDDIEDLRRRLRDAESTISALVSGQVDAVMDAQASSALLLQAAQDSLRASEARFRALVENSHDAILLLSREETIQYASPAIERMLGYAPDELIGTSARDLVHPEEAGAIGDLVESVVNSQSTPLRGSARLRHKDGSWRFVKGAMTNHLDDPHVQAIVSNIRDVTDEQVAQETVQRRDLEFHTVFERAIDAMVIADDHGTYIDVNPSAAELFGMSREALIGRNVREFAEPGFDTETAWQRFREDRRMTGEFRLQRPDGRILDTEYSASPLSEGRHLSVLRDVTESRRHNRQQEAQLAVTRTLASATTIEATLTSVLGDLCSELLWDAAVFWQAADGDSLVATETHFQTSAAVDAAALGTQSPTSASLPILVRQAGRPEYREDTEAAGSSHDVAMTRAGFVTALAFPVSAEAGASGEGVIELLSKRPWPRDAELLSTLRQLGVYLGQFIRRKRTEDALRQSEASLAAAQAIARLGSWEYDLTAKTAFWSDETYRIFGFEPGSVEPTTDVWLPRVHPDDRDTAQTIIDRIAEGLPPPALEYRVLHPDGQCRTVLISARAEEGPTPRITGTIQDVTERRRLEEQLLHAQKLEAVGRLAAGVAHDFNNVLTVIQSYARFLTQAVQDAEAQSDLQAILDATKRAANLVSQLLAFSRQQVVRPQPINLGETLAPLEKLLRRLLPESIAVIVELPESETIVRMDPTQLDQVVLNIAVNARDAMPRGGQLTVRAGIEHLDAARAAMTPYSNASDYAVLEIVDTGLGMDEATKARIFEPFYSTKGAAQGTGLGLSTVHGIVHQAGGHIEVDSAPSRGTVFRVRLPLHAPAREANTTRPSAPPQLRGTETILLIEDDEAVRRATGRLLRTSGYHVLSARLGNEAVELAASRNEPIHLVLTDVIMPSMSGIDAYDAVSARHPNAAVVYMSGYADSTIAEYGVLEGDVPFLPKPFTPDLLLRIVREAIDAAAARHETAAGADA